MWLNILPGTGQPSFPPTNGNSASVEKCWPGDMVASFMIIIFLVQGVVQVDEIESEGHMMNHSFIHLRNKYISYCPRLWDTAIKKILCSHRAHILGRKFLLFQIFDFSRTRTKEDQSSNYVIIFFCIYKKSEALLQPITYNKNHVIFIIFAKTNSHREFLCEMLCIYLRVSVNWLRCESERLFDFVSLRSGKMQHKNISVPQRNDGLQMAGQVTLS